MKKQPATETAKIVTLLSVSPNHDDHYELQGTIQHSKWLLHQADGLGPALAILHDHEIGVVLCERDLQPGSWIDLLEQMPVPDGPPLIVTSRLADERLWSEALNLGAYDVLAKPFERRELVRSVSMAWLHWRHRHDSAKSVRVMKAAS